MTSGPEESWDLGNIQLRNREPVGGSGLIKRKRNKWPHTLKTPTASNENVHIQGQKGGRNR